MRRVFDMLNICNVTHLLMDLIYFEELEDWDELLRSYYGCFLALQEANAEDGNMMFHGVDEEGFVHVFKVDEEVFKVEEKMLGAEELGLIKGLYVPNEIVENHSNHQILYTILKGLYKQSKLKAVESKSEFEKVKKARMKTKRIFNRNGIGIPNAENIRNECKKLVKGYFYTRGWDSLLYKNFFSESACRFLVWHNPADARRCEKLYKKMRTIFFERSAEENSGCRKIIISDNCGEERMLPLVYVEEADKSGHIIAKYKLEELLGMDIEIQMRDELENSYIIALICLCILYPMRMARQMNLEEEGIVCM